MVKNIKTGSDFSGVGALDQALERLGIKQDKKFACDMDKYARQTYILNYGEPEYYPENVYNREIPDESLDLYVTSPPCQSFSLAGKRKGEESKKGILFYNSHEFIQKNKPRFFIFENVKGLLSDDKDKNNKHQVYGKTFKTWLQYLGGKSINALPTLFPHEKAVPYHIYYKVLNAKDYGIPQNRERVFIVGIRDDQDNDFSWAKSVPLKKRLIDVLEPKVDKKYYLSETMVKGFISHKKRHDSKGNGFGFNFSDLNKWSKTITTAPGTRNTDNYIKEGYINQDTQASTVINENSISQTLCAGTHGYENGYVKIGAIRGRNPDNTKSRESGLHTEQMLELNESGTSNCLTTVQKDNVVVYVKSENSKGYEKATNQDSINLTFHKSSTRRGRVGMGVCQTLDTQCNQGVIDGVNIRKLTPLECFRLMDFNKSFKWNVSDTQAYKQAGNSIAVGVLASIINKLKL